MLQNNHYLGTEQMDYGEWSASLRSHCGRHSVVEVDANSFSGRLRTLSVCGFTAVDICCNAHRFERNHQDVRLDDWDHYKAVFQVAGRSTIYQNDQCVRLAVGDIALVDAARPMTCVSDDARVQRFSLLLPRRSLVSHLGFEPQGGVYRHSGAPAARLLHEVVHDALKGIKPECSPVDSYMQLAVYNLLGALFAPPDPPPSMRTSCSCVSAPSSKIALPIPNSALRKRHLRPGSRYATCRSSLRSAALLARILSIRFV